MRYFFPNVPWDDNFFGVSTWLFHCSLEVGYRYINKHFQCFWKQSTWTLQKTWLSSFVPKPCRRADRLNSVTAERRRKDWKSFLWVHCGGCIYIIPPLSYIVADSRLHSPSDDWWDPYKLRTQSELYFKSKKHGPKYLKPTGW